MTPKPPIAVPFQKIVFVCINRREGDEPCCAARGSEAIAAALKERVKAMGLSRRIRISKSGCQDLCAQGPTVMVFPDYVCYQGVTRNDIDRILRDITKDEPAGGPTTG